MSVSKILRCYFNWLAKDGITEPEEGWPVAIRDAGYDGVQFVEPLEVEQLTACRSLGLGVCGSGRVNTPGDASYLAENAKQNGLEALTLHVGWGLEDDREATALIDSILNVSECTGVPMYPETHRATIFQDMWRTVRFVRQFPELKFNGDFSHWYTGLEMVYGDFDRKIDFIQPVLDRVWFMHGRIGNPGCMQVDVGRLPQSFALSYVQHFCSLWRKVFAAFFRRSEQQAFCFAVELLAPAIYYARTFGGREESDRWEQSLQLCEIARKCFTEAQSGVGTVR